MAINKGSGYMGHARERSFQIDRAVIKWEKTCEEWEICVKMDDKHMDQYKDHCKWLFKHIHTYVIERKRQIEGRETGGEDL